MNCDSSELKFSTKLINFSFILINLFIIILFATTMAFPSYAESNRGYGDKPGTFSQLVSFKNPEKVRLGITPTGWSNSDDRTIDTVPPIPYQQMLSEIALSGYKGAKSAPKFPNKEKLKEELSLRGLTITEP